jgi:aminoglycoside/choline kinase family phosphotransferase
MTPDWFVSLLRAAGFERSDSVVDVKIEPIGTGQLARMVRAELVFDTSTDVPKTLIVKYPSDDQRSLGFALTLGMYELEVRFYREVAPLLGEMRIPTCYLAEVEPDSGMFTLVLEDLSESTRPGDVLTESTPDECSAVLAQLVNLQAPLWSSGASSQLGWLSDPTRTTQLFDGLAVGLEPFLERFGSALDPDHVDLFKSVMPKAGEWARSWKAPTVLQHGDFRSDNVMFGVAPGAPPVTVIDFQLIRLGPPGFDPAYFLASSLSSETRREVERDLITEYHQRLVSAGVSGFDFDQCWAAYREGAMYGVFMFCGAANQVEATERGDRMVLNQVERYADMALDLESPAAAGLI